MPNKCKCGCGESVSNNYVIGHNRRGVTNTSESNAKRSASLKGRPGTFLNRSHSDSTKEKLSRIFSGSGNPMYGRTHASDTKEKIRQAHIGKTHTSETKELIRLAHIGKTLTPEQCKKISLSKLGKKRKPFSAEWRKKISNHRKGKPSGSKGYKWTPEQLEAVDRSLDKNGRWRGGVSFEEYPAEFDQELKNKVRIRDRHQCRNPLCWGKDSMLHVHHIDYNKQNCCSENLVTICRSCNSRANKEREKWKRMYQNLKLEASP